MQINGILEIVLSSRNEKQLHSNIVPKLLSKTEIHLTSQSPRLGSILLNIGYVLYWFRMKQTQMYVCTLCRIYSSWCSHIAVLWWSEDMDWNPHRFMYKCNNRHEKTLRCLYKKRWQLLSAGIVIAQRFDTWDGHSRFLNALHTYELSDVSTGEFIDTLSLSHPLLVGETVNCCQHIEDLKAIGNSRYRNKFYWVSSKK